MNYAQPANCTNPNQGWRASLSLSFEKGPERTVVRRRHTGPLTIQRPFFPENSVAHVYMLHPPGGVVGGDLLTIEASVDEGASGLVTTPGATKFYRSKEASVSSFSQSLNVQGGSLEWFPQENIFFNGCTANLSTTINADANAAIALWDIQCFGRPAGGELFRTGSVTNKLKVLVENNLIFLDRLVINDKHPLSQHTGLGAQPVTGTLLLNKMTQDACDLVRNLLSGQSSFFVTLVDSLLILRYIGNSVEQSKQGFIQVWKQLRYSLNQRHPSVPRIWAT